MTVRSIIAGAGTLTVGRVLSQVLALVRHVIVGRMLSPGDLGVAAVLMLTSALLELTTQFSVDKLLVQAKDGGDPGLQRVAHRFLAMRGVVVGIAAIALAFPIASAFGIPHAAWAFTAYAAVPIIGGVRHLDSRRYHRDGRFAPDMIVEVVPQVIAALVAWPLVFWIGGYAAVVWLLILKAALSVAVSHVVARRAYGWSWDRANARRIVSFGWPLLAGSAVMFVISQGDQLVVGAGYSMYELGLFAVAATLALAVATMLSSISSTLMLPVLAARIDDRLAFARAHATGVLAHGVVGCAVGSTLIVGGSILVTGLYGDAYAGAGALLGWLGVMQCVRLMRVTTTVAAIARGDTLSPLIANLWRMSVIPGAVGVAAAGLDLFWIPAIGIAGEVLAIGVLCWRVKRKHGVDPSTTLAATAVSLGVMGVVASGTATLGIYAGASAAATVLIGIAALIFVGRNRWAKAAVRFQWMPEAVTTEGELRVGEVAG